MRTEKVTKKVKKCWDIWNIFRTFMVVPYIKKKGKGRTVQGKYTKFRRHMC